MVIVKTLNLQRVFHGIRLLRLMKRLVVVRQSIFFAFRPFLQKCGKVLKESFSISEKSRNFVDWTSGQRVFTKKYNITHMKRIGFLLIALFATAKLFAQQEVVSNLEVFDILTGESTLVRTFPYTIEAPNWTPDGRWIVYNSQGRLYRLAANGRGEPEEINTGFAGNCNNDHVISANGKNLAISHHTREDFQSRIYILPLKGGTPQLITPIGPSYLHGWSSDGKMLAYCANRHDEWDIYTIASTGGEEKRMTTAVGLDDGPEYSPDGMYIWFNSVRTGEMQVWRMKADGSEQTQMTFDHSRNAWFPHVSPNGKWVVYIAYHKGDLEPAQHLPGYDVDLMMMPADGTENPRKLTSLYGGQGSLNVNSWAPDSHRFCYVSYARP